MPPETDTEQHKTDLGRPGTPQLHGTHHYLYESSIPSGPDDDDYADNDDETTKQTVHNILHAWDLQHAVQKKCRQDIILHRIVCIASTCV